MTGVCSQPWQFSPAEKQKPKSIAVLGSTGSIGCSTLDLVARSPERFRITALTANRNVDLLIEQARQFQPDFVAIGNEAAYGDLKNGLASTRIEVGAGPQALVEAAERRSDLVMAGIVGAAGLQPALAAVERGAVVALANKECLVCAGDLFMQRVRQTGATLIPVDSEHNAIFQVFDFEYPETVSHITLTASGGPFRTMPMEQMRHVSPEEALRHPNWDMGDKITIDSATMMNKGLEMIEAYHLFPVTPEQIRVLVHPQSVIHSLVSYIDGSTLAQMGQPDMRTPIAYAMAWPERMPAPAAELDLSAIGTLTFEAPDEMRFPALRLAREALQSGGAAPTILNAANEVAVAKFLSGEIGFLQIADSVEQVLNQMTSCKINSLEDVFEADSEAREKVLSLNGLRSKGALGT